MEVLEVFINEDGTVQHVYDDRLAALFAADVRRTARASHVEPFGQGWIADMRPVGGMILGADGSSYDPIDMAAGLRLDMLPVEMLGPVQTRILAAVVKPFPTRAAALAAEVAWLRARMAEGRVSVG